MSEDESSLHAISVISYNLHKDHKEDQVTALASCSMQVSILINNLGLFMLGIVGE